MSFPHCLIALSLIAMSVCGTDVIADGTLVFSIADESTGDPVPARVELTRRAITPSGKSKALTPRRTAKAGIGFVLDREAEISLGDGGYQFRIIRGPEYRIITGNFSLTRTSEDSHHVDLPRMISMRDAGWISGDMGVTDPDKSLPLRMAGEDLHVALTTEPSSKPQPMVAGIARSPNDPIKQTPLWIDPTVRIDRGLAFYGDQETLSLFIGADALPVRNLVAAKNADGIKTAIENPFDLAVPVWLASEKVDGMFLFGDWLRLDQNITKVPVGGYPFPWQPTRQIGAGQIGAGQIGAGQKRAGQKGMGSKDVGRWAETIYWNMLEAGFRIVPLAGSGDQSGNTPVGYNRIYVTQSGSTSSLGEPDSLEAPGDLSAWQSAAWSGRTMVTNGPMLRALASDRPPGHTFVPEADGKVRIKIAIDLATRDPVDYMEVVHNGKIHYNARLDEFAKAGGVIPNIETDQSGWFLVRVVTLHEDHFRAASTAPWFIDVGGQPRVTKAACTFFQEWLESYESALKKLPAKELKEHVPFVRAAREFWKNRAENAR